MIHRSPHPPVDIPLVSIPAFLNHHLDNSPYWSDPQRPVYIDGTSGEVLTITEFRAGIRAISAGWRSRAGLQKGDVVAVVAPNDIYYSTAIFSVLSAGGTISPINPAYTVNEMVYQLTDSGAKYIVVDTTLVDHIRRAATEVGIPTDRIYTLQKTDDSASLHSLRINPTHPSLAHHHAGEELLTPTELHHQPAYLCYSSGTTGRSKGVVTSHQNIVANLIQVDTHQRQEQQSHAGQVLAGVLPFYHIYGLNMLIHLTLVQGSTVVVTRKFDLQTFLAGIQKYRINFAYLVPPIVLQLVKHPSVASYDLSSLRGIASGAAPLSVSLARDIIAQYGLDVTQAFGMTESSPILFLSRHANRNLDAIGVPIPSVEAKIIDPVDGQLLGPHQHGEICVRGPNIMRGYWNNPAATAATIDAEGFLRTGDVGYVNESGEFFISDRLKELIKYKGFQVAPAELEAVVIQHPRVTDVVVIGVYQPEQATEVPRAYVVIKPSTSTSDSELIESDKVALAQDIMGFVSGQVAPHKKLRGGVFFVEEVPKSSSGKILRQALRKQLQKQLAEEAKGLISPKL
ncbi:4-coumarate--CoA ligase [Dimargaris cristalligena]|uniref:4-coumarate--CoA ligase n=1 Tax=Dimargaris cristalligena TaxID=215637 RepID=A0A4P9ZVH9_9FUNG|nr:4-coumarate--CoA ligase [Dimargaris cristalligena]|eukprot:RKP37597.1 4-coumarate--CoA ligase [Dimargaris cristalligena]